MRKQLKNITDTISRIFIRITDKAKMTEHTFMIIVALIIGVIGGFGSIITSKMIHWISSLSFPGPGTLLENLGSLPWYVIVAVPLIGGIIAGPIIFFLAPETKGDGVPEVFQSLILKGGYIRTRVPFIKTIASAVTIGTGGSVGREGPIVQIGAGLASVIGRFLRVSPSRMKTFVGCGVAAGIAATFNAPVGGALFALEILLGDFAFTQFSPVVISSVMATVIKQKFEGNFAAFQVPTYELVSPGELLFYFILGVLCALAAFIFIKVLYVCEDFFEKKLTIPEFLKPALGGLAIGILALAAPQIIGLGYESINHALHDGMLWYLALGLIFVKIVAASVTLGSGGAGGVFSPSLFIGAMLGYAFGWLVHLFFPHSTATPGAYALVAMAGLVAGAMHAPITAIIIVFELTYDYHIILPLMITCIISTALATNLSRESIYTLKLVLKNIFLKFGAEIDIMKSMFVKDVYTPRAETIPAATKFNDIVNIVLSGKNTSFPVLDKSGSLVGMITLNDVKDNLFEKDVLKDILIAGDIAVKDFESVTPDDNCQTVLNRLRERNTEGLPVVSQNRPDKLLGMVWRRDVLVAYNREIEHRDIASNLASKIIMKDVDRSVHFMEGYAITEIPVPKWFEGRSIREINVRARFGVDIILIKNEAKPGSKYKVIPDPGYVFSTGDSIVIAGEIGKINILKNRT
jgi:CIC family chloride channel protein